MTEFSFYRNLIRPLLFRMDPETAHEFILKSLSFSAVGRVLSLGLSPVQKPVDLWGLRFRNPLGLAAGADKNAIALSSWEQLGFGFCEIGTVTRYPHPGNKKPRIFRRPSAQGIVNRLGFPNDGSGVIKKRLEEYRKIKSKDFPLGVNIGISKDIPLETAPEEYLFLFRELYETGDYFVINVSSPNTPGLRTLQSSENFAPILKTVQAWNREQGMKPLLVKISPDLEDGEIISILGLIEEFGLHGLVATNTTLSVQDKEKGGVSGKPLAKRSTEVIRLISKESGGRISIIGVGGIFNENDYKEKLDAGASLVQLYTGMIYEGPRIVRRILER